MKWLFTNIIVRNLLAAAIVSALLCFFVFRWLDSYTRHGESVEIPDVKGMTIEKAETVFAKISLDWQVIDSAFYSNLPAGAIIETLPAAGSKVKKGRTVFIRINSHEAQLTQLPEVKDMSQRQAVAILRSMGFENITVKLVPGPFRDLVVGLESSGREMQTGDKAPLTIPLDLIVSDGDGEMRDEAPAEGDSAEIEHPSEENWY
jgi:hypothetical protein